MTDTNPQASDERYLALNVKFPRTIDCGYHRHSGKYSIFPRQHRREWIRTYGIVLNSVGVSVSLVLQSTQHRLFHKDIGACEKSWLRWVQSRLTRHGQAKSYKLIRECLVGQLNALVFLDKSRQNMELEKSRGLSQRPAYPCGTGLGQCRDTLSKVGNTSLLPV